MKTLHIDKERSEMNTPGYKSVIFAIRPKTLLTGIGPVILGGATGFRQIQETWNTQSTMVILACLLCTILMQSGANLVNDVKDFESGVDKENRKGPPRATQMGWLQPRQVKYLYTSFFVIAFLVGLFLIQKGGIPILITGLFCLSAAYLYTGGPKPLSRNALGELTALIFFGPIAVGGTFYLITTTINIQILITGMGAGFTSAALMAINNLRDRTEDQTAGKKTLATLLPEKAAGYLPTVFFTAALAILVFHGVKVDKTVSAMGFSGFLTILLVLKVFPNLYGEKKFMNKALGGAASFSIFYSILYSFLVLK